MHDGHKEYFLKLLGEKQAVFKGSIPEDYTHDEMPEYGIFEPDALLLPSTTAEVSEIMRYCCENDIPVTPRGAGTGLCGGCVATCGGVLLCLRNMNKILELDENNLIVTVESGVLHMELSRFLEPMGLLYPPDPGEKTATLGGNVMTNAGGMRAVKYGVTRDYVAGMEIVLPNGEIEFLGGKSRKNSTGYSLKDLIIGSEGTLAVVTQIQLRVIPMPKSVLTLLVPFDSAENCIATPPKIIRERITPVAVEFMQREVIALAEEYLGRIFPDKQSEAYLLLRFDGDSRQEFAAVYERVAEICLENGARDVLIADTEERQTNIWNMRGAFLEAIKSSTRSMDECDVVVPLDKITDFLAFVDEARESFKLKTLYFGHAGDGNFHIYLLKENLDDDVWKSKNQSMMEALYKKAYELGGFISGEHGIGHGKAEFLREKTGGAAYGLMRGIKQVFDPKNLLNPGKVVDRYDS